MVYRIDNRPKKHRGRYTVLGIILGISFTIGGFYLYDNYKQPILDNANQIKSTAIAEIEKTKPVQTILDNSQNIKTDQTQNNNLVQESSIPLEQLKQIAVDDINNYRKQSGLSPVIMENSHASQVWAEHLLSEGCIAHREGNSGPIQRYVDNGDKLQMIFENISGGYGTQYSNPIDAIKQANYEMMNNDVDQNNGHRDNILNPSHTSVSIGLGYNSNKMVIVEDFQEPIIPGWKQYDMSYSDQKACW